MAIAPVLKVEPEESSLGKASCSLPQWRQQYQIVTGQALGPQPLLSHIAAWPVGNFLPNVPPLYKYLISNNWSSWSGISPYKHLPNCPVLITFRHISCFICSKRENKSDCCILVSYGDISFNQRTNSVSLFSHSLFLQKNIPISVGYL